MSRPDYPNCVMTAGMIRRIREKQEAYDQNPRDYEAREQQRKEARQREEWEMNMAMEEDKQREEWEMNMAMSNEGSNRCKCGGIKLPESDFCKDCV